MAASDTQLVVLITGATRGLGVELARAALAGGHAVVASGRSAERVTEALGTHPDLMAVALDITDTDSVKDAVNAVLERHGRIDVLFNNAGNTKAGFFEEITRDDFRAQMDINVFGTLELSRRVLPAMRAQRSGTVVTISSQSGLIGDVFTTAYSASKFALEGWMESLAPEIEPFGIHTMLVEPGFFRTELLGPESTSFAEPAIEDYATRREQTMAQWRQNDGTQAGDPAKLAHALMALATSDDPPSRFVAGADAVQLIEAKAHQLLAQIDAHRELSTSLDHAG